MVLHSKLNCNSSLLLIAVMNVLAFILCLCAIFLPSMPNEDGKLFFLLNMIFLFCCFNTVRLLILPRSVSLFTHIANMIACVYVALRVCVCNFFSSPLVYLYVVRRMTMWICLSTFFVCYYYLPNSKYFFTALQMH